MHDFDLIVIGSGPGGYVAAIRAAQLGLKTAVIEKDKPGGVCLNIGCIPSKALIHQAEIFRSLQEAEDFGIKIDRSSFDYSKVFAKSRQAAEKLSKGIMFLMKKNKIEFIQGAAALKEPGAVSIDGEKIITAKNIIIAAGSRPREIPGFFFDEEYILSSTGALMLEKLPKKMLILGAGAIGIEFAHIFNSFGVEVTLVEMMDRILPLEDSETVQVLARDFKRRKIKIMTEAKALGYEKHNGMLHIKVQDKKGAESIIEADKMLVAVGRAPNGENLGLENLNIKTAKGFIETGDYYETTCPGVYAIGDIIDTHLLAHVASKEGEIAVEHIAGLKTPKKIDPMLIPGAVYSEPQMGSFGLTEDKAKEMNIPYKKSVFPYRGAGKSVAIEKPEGLVKVLCSPQTGEILGASIAGAEATEMIHELLLAKSAELLPSDTANMIHAHPTLSETIMEAMRGIEGQPIHA